LNVLDSTLSDMSLQSQYIAGPLKIQSHYMSVYTWNGGRVNFSVDEVEHSDGTKGKLSRREAELLHYFAANVGRVITRDELLSNVWRLNPERVLTRTIDMHISKLRHKLRDAADKSRVLVTLHSRGYMLTDEKVAA
jgi:DNA-binding response OmpR family regulator